MPNLTTFSSRRGTLALALLFAAWPTAARSAPQAESGGLGAVYGERTRGSRRLTAPERASFQQQLDRQRDRIMREAVVDVPRGGKGMNRATGHAVFGLPSDIAETPNQKLIARPRYLSLYENKQPLGDPAKEMRADRSGRGKLGSDKSGLSRAGRLTAAIADRASTVKRRLGRNQPFKLGARWVAFMTEGADVLPEMERPNNHVWQGEDSLPKRFATVLENSWKGLFRKTRTSAFHDDGVSRGHLADFGGSKRNRDEALSTFRLMSNAHAQWRDNNAGPWHTLERDIRHLAESGYKIYQYAGPQWSPYTYTKRNGEEQTVVPRVLRGKIPVPTAFWKVAVAVPGDKPLADAVGDARVFSVVVPNTKDIGVFASSWTRFSEKPRDMERTLGLEFFTNLPNDIRQAWLDHRDMREGFEFGHDIPKEWKLRVLKNVSKMGGLPEDQAAADELIRNGRITDH